MAHHNNNDSRILETDSRDPDIEIGILEAEKKVHEIHGTLETGLQIMLRSLVAPSRGAGGFFISENLKI